LIGPCPGDFISLLRGKINKGKLSGHLPALILIIYLILVSLLLTSPWRFVGKSGETFWQVSMALNYDHYSLLTPFSTAAGDFANLPPLYSWIIRLAMVSTGHIEAGRIVSLMFGIGTLLLTFKICELLYGRKTGHVAMLLLSTSLLFIVVSTVMMPETTMLFFSALSIFLLMKFLETDNKKYLFAVGAAAFLSAFAKWPGIFTLVGVGTYLLHRKGFRILRDPAFHVSMFVPVFLCLIWIFHIQSIALKPVLGGLFNYLFFNLEAPLHEVFAHVGYELTIYVPLTTLGLALAGIVLTKEKNRLPLFWLMGGTFFYLLFLKGAAGHHHYSSLMLPPLAILGAQGAVALSNKVGSIIKRRRQPILLVLSVILVLITFGGIGYISHYFHQRYGLYVDDMCLSGEHIQNKAGENGLVALSGDAVYVYLFHTSIDISRIRIIDLPYDESINELVETPKIIVAVVKNPEGKPPLKVGLSENEFEDELGKILALDNYRLLKGHSYFRIITKVG
jgi:4-amino-4-deoxy-L-arabinose transferase-like glycosyltransferase